MRETKHTPAPWRAVRSNPAEGADVWWIVGNTASHNQEKDIGTVQGGLSPTHEADAALIAAAPDMLAALRHAQTFIANGRALGFIRMPDQDTPDPAHKTPGIINAAIAKATGASA